MKDLTSDLCMVDLVVDKVRSTLKITSIESKILVKLFLAMEKEIPDPGRTKHMTSV